MRGTVVTATGRYIWRATPELHLTISHTNNGSEPNQPWAFLDSDVIPLSSGNRGYWIIDGSLNLTPTLIP